MLNVLLEFPLNYSQIFFYANIYPNMFSEKYTVKIIINKELLFSRDYTTYNAILQDFPEFEKSENVRTCKRMLEKHKNPTYKKAQKNTSTFKCIKRPRKLRTIPLYSRQLYHVFAMRKSGIHAFACKF